MRLQGERPTCCTGQLAEASLTFLSLHAQNARCVSPLWPASEFDLHTDALTNARVSGWLQRQLRLTHSGCGRVREKLREHLLNSRRGIMEMCRRLFVYRSDNYVIIESCSFSITSCLEIGNEAVFILSTEQIFANAMRIPDNKSHDWPIMEYARACGYNK